MSDVVLVADSLNLQIYAMSFVVFITFLDLILIISVFFYYHPFYLIFKVIDIKSCIILSQQKELSPDLQLQNHFSQP